MLYVNGSHLSLSPRLGGITEVRSRGMISWVTHVIE